MGHVHKRVGRCVLVHPLLRHPAIYGCPQARVSGRLAASNVRATADAKRVKGRGQDQVTVSCGGRLAKHRISVLCTVFSLLNTFQQRVISSSEIIFEFEPRSVNHSSTATAGAGIRLSKPCDGICEFRPEASTFQALLLEIAFE